MVFGSSLLLIALLLSGGQPILPEDQPIVSSVKKTAVAKSETGSLVPCPDAIAGRGSCGCKTTCEQQTTVDVDTPYYVKENGKYVKKWKKVSTPAFYSGCEIEGYLFSGKLICNYSVSGSEKNYPKDRGKCR